MSSLTIEQKIGQLFLIGIPGPSIDDQTQKLLDRIQPGGVCLFARNIRERTQTRQLLETLISSLPIVPFLSIDQEGGLVDRLRRIVTPMPAADKIKSVDEAAAFGRIVGEILRLLGFNMNFAPVVDVIDEGRGQFSNGLHSRVFGRSARDATKLSRAFLDAMQSAGCIGCLKHFPGLGATDVDSHKELPTVSIADDELRSRDLVPYSTMLPSGTVRSVMIAHAAYKNLSLQEVDQSGTLLPSSLSPAIITTLLRGELGFDGLVLTDDLEMGAIVDNYGIGDACKMAIVAGADMLSICASVDAIDEGHAAITDTVRSGEIDIDRIDRSVERISFLKNELEPPPPFDDERLTALSDEISGLIDRLK